MLGENWPGGPLSFGCRIFGVPDFPPKGGSVKRRQLLALSCSLCLIASLASAGSKEAAKPAGPANAAAAPALLGKGKVVETMDTAGYTYVHVDVGGKKIWAAAPQFKVKVGNTVSVPEGLPMSNYYSKTLKRTFDLVYFVPVVKVEAAK